MGVDKMGVDKMGVDEVGVDEKGSGTTPYTELSSLRKA